MKNQRSSALKKVLHHLSRYRAPIVLSAILAVLSVGLTLAVPLLVGEAIDRILGEGAVGFSEITRLLLLIGGAVLVTALFQWIMTSINNRITYHTVEDMRNEAFTKIQSLPLSYLDTHPHGETVSRVISDVDQFADGLLLGFTQMLTGVMTILGALVFMLITDVRLALLVALLTPLSLFIARFIGTRTHSMFHAQSVSRAEMTAYTEEMLRGQKLVRAYSREGAVSERFDAINDQLNKASLRAIFFSSLTNPTTRFVNNVIYAAVALVGALMCISSTGEAGAFTVGALTAMLSYVNQYTKPFNEISGVITEFQNALASAERVYELIEEPSEVSDQNATEVLEDVHGEVAFSDVSFSYTEQKRLIEHLSFSAKQGMRVAIVGPTGCGKTTLINLLMRFYDVTAGAIRVDGCDIRALKRDNLRENYGMVLQESHLKSGTIRENLIIGKPDATDEEIIRAAKLTHAHSFIKRLSNGYDTVIGEDGGMLSAGQKQLLCVTRLMLALPPMLILDEATSSIDTRTEMRIQRAFAIMMEGRTSFIVAHRLSTIREADLILVMKDGSIVEEGTHEQLLAKGGFYKELYNSQFEE